MIIEGTFAFVPTLIALLLVVSLMVSRAQGGRVLRDD